MIIQPYIILCGGVVVLAGVLILRQRREQRRRKIALQVERMELANKPGYRPPGHDGMQTSIQDGVITYRRKRKADKEKDYK